MSSFIFHANIVRQCCLPQQKKTAENIKIEKPKRETKKMCGKQNF
jgi:hypothetical protein